MRYRIQLYWGSRDEPPARCALRLFMLLSALRGVDDWFGDFRWFDPARGTDVPIRDKAAVEQALLQGAVAWQTGPTQHTSYKLSLTAYPPEPRAGDPLDRPGGIAPATLELVCGINATAVPAFMPNRLQLLVRPWAGEHGADRPLLERLARAAIQALSPDWGFVGSERIPDPPVPIFSDGAPAVGWMTYLSSRYPPLPPLRDPSEVHAIGGQGQLVIAHHDRFDERDDTHLAAIARVRQALLDAGVLLSERALRRA